MTRALRAVCSLALLATVESTVPAVAEVYGRYTPGGEPIPREIRTSKRMPVPTFGLLLPLFVVDTASPAGVTTLFAVRNASSSAIRAGIRYTSVDGAVTVTENILLDARETVTTNLRDIPGLPVTNGFLKGGVVEIEALDPITSQPVSADVFTGDYFYADLGNNFASGDVLVDATTGLCQNWDTRYFNGGAFSGGTVFTFTTLQNPTDGALRRIATGDVYTEPGVLVGTVQIFANQIASQITSTELGLPTFGTVEWVLDQGVGLVNVTFKAEGRYSVGMPGFCLD